MRDAATYIEGTHDFRSFQNATTEDHDSTVRDIFTIRVIEEAPLVHVQVAGSAFLYRMVRTMVGTLLEVGQGQRTAVSMRDVLEAKDRRRAGWTAEARGLCLVGVFYNRDDLEDAMKVSSLLAPFWMS